MIPTVVIPIINNDRREHYEHLARRAISSVEQQTVITPYIVSYGDTLADAKNSGVERADSEAVMILDADDIIDFDFMRIVDGVDEWEIIKPRVYLNGVLNAFPQYDIRYKNYLINGAPYRTELWESVGGYEDRAYEDWMLYAKMVIKNDPNIVYLRDAIYHYITDGQGLNAQATDEDMRLVLKDIADYAAEHA